MVVAYPALVSLLQILDSLLKSAARGSRVSLNRAQLKTLHEKVRFLLDFLENSSSNYGKRRDPDLESLETKIILAAYKVEDVIVSAISNQLLAESEIVRYSDFLGSFFDMELRPLAPKKEKDLWTQILNSVMCVLPISVQSFLTLSFQNLIFVFSWIWFVFQLLFGLTYFFLIMIAGEAKYEMDKAVSRGICFATRYWRCVCQPENQDLRGAIDDMSFIMKEVIKFKDSCGSGQYRESQTPHSADGLSRRDFGSIGKNVVVKLDSDLNEIYDRLIGHSSQLEIVSIVGMGGIGKTTLARQVYDVPHHFDTRAWVSVSQDYSLRRVMLDLLHSAKIDTKEILKKHRGDDDDDLDQILCEHLYKHLMSRRYLVVMDDMWDTKIWDFVRRFFPDNQNGSRVLLTSRLSEVASYADPGSPPLQMQLLNDDDSWHLLREKVFRGEGCPHELETIGRTIARNCRGLPLAIVVTAGLLYNVDRTKRLWKRVSKRLNSKSYDEQCLEILGLSYNNLPHHLKPCFLYMGAFLGVMEISATKLFNLWATEGLLKPSESKSLEEVAEEYLKDLIQRNLILVGKRSCNGNIKTCRIHDLLRDVCLLNARKENFLDFANRDGENRPRVCNQSVAFADPSFIRYGTKVYSQQQFYSCFGLVRVLELLIQNLHEFPDEFFTLVQLRYLSLTCERSLPPTISRLWNLQTIVLHHNTLLPVEIWLLPNLRHLYLMEGWLPEPPGCQLLCDTILENLQTLVGVSYFPCTKDFFKRIPNLKKLVIVWKNYFVQPWPKDQLESLVNLHQLTTLKITVKDRAKPPKLAFPQKLKRLSLSGCRIPWESMTVVGALPNLQVLKLKNDAFVGGNWEPVEGEFCQLKVLLIEGTDLEHWIANETHFPCLQRLILRWCRQLQEIPCGMGDIPTLEQIELVNCHPCAVASAEQILEEQQDMGNEDLKIHIENHEWRWWRKTDKDIKSESSEPDQGNSEDLGTRRSRTRPTKKKITKGKRRYF